MRFARSRLAILGLAMAPMAWAQDLPVKSPGVDLQKESAELIDGLPDLNRMHPVEEAPPVPSTLFSVEAEQARLEAARRKQQRWEKLARQGVLSQAEAEQCQLEVAVALARCERARLNQSQHEMELAQQQKSDPALLQAAAAAVESGKALAADAELQLGRTRLRLAQVNLQRMRTLYAERLTTKGQVDRAQNQVAKFQTEVPAP